MGKQDIIINEIDAILRNRGLDRKKVTLFKFEDDYYIKSDILSKKMLREINKEIRKMLKKHN